MINGNTTNNITVEKITAADVYFVSNPKTLAYNMLLIAGGIIISIIKAFVKTSENAKNVNIKYPIIGAITNWIIVIKYTNLKFTVLNLTEDKLTPMMNIDIGTASHPMKPSVSPITPVNCIPKLSSTNPMSVAMSGGNKIEFTMIFRMEVFTSLL